MKYVIPTFHPSFILRGNRKYLGIFQQDMARAVSVLAGWTPEWTHEPFVLRPTAAQVVDYCRRAIERRAEVALDIETNGDHVLKARVRCLALYDGESSMCVPFLYRDGTFREFIPEGKKKIKRVAHWATYWSADDYKKVVAAIQSLINHCTIIFQNGQFDRTGTEASALSEYPRLDLDWSCAKTEDTILASHVLLPFLPHSLGFLCSIYLDVCFYKKTEEGEAWSTRNDNELYLYCCRDTKATWLIMSKMKQELGE